MHIRIVSDLSTLSDSVAEALRGAGYEVETRYQSAHTCEIRYTTELPMAELSKDSETSGDELSIPFGRHERGGQGDGIQVVELSESVGSDRAHQSLLARVCHDVAE